MGCLLFSIPTMINPSFKCLHHSRIDYNSISCKIGPSSELIYFLLTSPRKYHLNFSRIPRIRSLSDAQSGGEADPEEESVDDLRVPNQWLNPSRAHEESEWLRVTLHKWLDDEYCPEATNITISEVASNSFYKSLMEKRTDLGEILLKMARELESISYQESFHGAFSSANAAIDLIIQRIQQD